jgi:hypothetical protein
MTVKNFLPPIIVTVMGFPSFFSPIGTVTESACWPSDALSGIRKVSEPAVASKTVAGVVPKRTLMLSGVVGRFAPERTICCPRIPSVVLDGLSVGCWAIAHGAIAAKASCPMRTRNEKKGRANIQIT